MESGTKQAVICTSYCKKGINTEIEGDKKPKIDRVNSSWLQANYFGTGEFSVALEGTYVGRGRTEDDIYPLSAEIYSASPQGERHTSVSPRNSDNELRAIPTVNGNLDGSMRVYDNSNNYRNKLLYTIILWWSFIVLGWEVAQFGPSFPELRSITNTSLQKASAFVTSGAVGYLTGALIGGLLLKKCQSRLLLCLSYVGFGILTSVVPWCTIYEVMVLVMCIRNIFTGIQDTVTNADLLHTWAEENKSYMQALHFFFAFGGILSPLATAPFLTPTTGNALLSSAGNVSSTDTPNFVTNMTYVDIPTNVSHDTILHNFSGQSRLYIPYSITTALCLLTAPLFLVSFLLHKNRIIRQTTRDNTNRDTEQQKMPVRIKVVLLTFILSLMALHCAAEESFSTFLSTFLEKQMKWSPEIGAYATSVFWGLFCGGRFFGIFIIRCVRPSALIIFCNILLASSYVGLFFSALWIFDIGIWLSVAVAGMSVSVVFPTIFSWTEERFFPVTGIIASCIMISATFGAMINPLIMGFLMDNFTPLYFCYLPFGECFVFFVLFVLASKMAKKVKCYRIPPKNVCLDIRL